MKIQLSKIVPYLLLCLILCACSSKNTKRIVLPDMYDIESIHVVFNEQTETHTELAWIETALTGLSSAVDTGKESVQDAPNVESYFEVRLAFYEGNHSIVYIYEQDGKFYVEQPYQGIWEIENDLYSFLTDAGEY